MKQRIFAISGIFCLLLMLAPSAAQAAGATFIVAPFSVDGPQGFAYLKQSIPSMFTSRLYWQGHFEPAAQSGKAQQQAVTSDAQAEQLRKAVQADYVIWGGVSIAGQDCNLSVNVRDKNGKKWEFPSSGKAQQLMTALKVTSDRINADVFKKQAGERPGSGGKKAAAERVNQMNPNIVINETTPKEVYLNPHFRYAGADTGDDTSTRSQRLPFTAVGMEICDADGDGRNEVFLLDDHKLYAYHFSSGKLEPAGQFTLPKNHDALSIRSFSDGGKNVRLLVNSVDTENLPQAYIFRYANGTFTQEGRALRFFMNVVNMPPLFKPVLIGQQAQPPKLFRPGVFEMTKTAGGYEPGNRLQLPPDANALNFAYLPGGFSDPGGDKLIVLGERERLKVYTVKGSLLAQTEESYSGSSKGFEIESAMPGMSRDKVTLKDMFYVPLRMLATDFEHDGKYELMVNKPISTASKLFDRYRFFPQSEVHSLFWDGIGMNLQWKTRRIKGSIADFTVADVNNDGIIDLAVLINTHPGALGVSARPSIVQFYPLDLTQIDPHTQPHKSFYEQE